MYSVERYSFLIMALIAVLANAQSFQLPDAVTADATTTTTVSSTGTGGSSLGLLVGILFGALILIVGAVWFVARRIKRQDTEVFKTVDTTNSFTYDVSTTAEPPVVVEFGEPVAVPPSSAVTPENIYYTIDV